MVLIFSLFIATLLNREMPGRALFRSVFFIPVILMTGIVAKTDSSALVQSILPGDGLSAGASTGNALDLGNIEAALSGLSLGTGAHRLYCGYCRQYLFGGKSVRRTDHPDARFPAVDFAVHL